MTMAMSAKPFYQKPMVIVMLMRLLQGYSNINRVIIKLAK